MNERSAVASGAGRARRSVYIVAGEPSGDAQAATLAAALRRADESIALRGVCGPLMRAAGVAEHMSITELSVMGIGEAIGALARVRRVYRRVVAELDSEHRPELLVLVDFPEFNLRLARAAKRRGIRVLYYVSPQVWAWRRGRVRSIRRNVDAMVVLFPFEEEFYSARRVRARFFGHPLAEEVRPRRSAGDTRARHGIDPVRPLVVLLPGSRRGEVARHLPLMLDAARLLGEDAQFVVAKASGLDEAVVRDAIAASRIPVSVIDGETYDLLAAADAAAAVSGTVTVECALLGCPPVVVYKMARSTYWVARALVRTPYVAMPNIVLGARVVPELIQAEATPEALAGELRRMLFDSSHRGATLERLAQLRAALVRPGAAERAAHFAMELLP